MMGAWQLPWSSSKADRVASSQHLGRAYTPFTPIEMSRDTLLQPETLDRGNSRRVAEPGLKGRVVEQAIERSRERGGVAGRDEQPSLTVCNDLRQGTDARGDDGTAACHRFQHRESAGLLPKARMHKYMGCSQQIWNVVTESEEFGSWRNAEAVAQLSKPRLVGTISDNQQPNVGRHQASERTQKVLNALLTDQIGDGDYANIRRAAAELPIRPEPVHVDPIVDRASPRRGKSEAPYATIAHVIGHSGKTRDPQQGCPVEERMCGSTLVVPVVSGPGKVVHEEDAGRPCRVRHQRDRVARGEQVQVQHIEATGQPHDGFQRASAQLFQGRPPDAAVAEPARDVRVQWLSADDLEDVPAPTTLRGEPEQPHLERAQLSSCEVHEQTDAECAHAAERATSVPGGGR